MKTNQVVIERQTKEVLDIVDQKFVVVGSKTFDLTEALLQSKKKTKFYTPWQMASWTVLKVKDKSVPTKFSVVNESVTVSIRRLAEQYPGDVLALNFASGKNPGGGFLRGAKTQEEDMCRSSNLYDCLKDHDEFYMLGGYLNTDNILYSPMVTFFKDEYYNNVEPFYCDIITCAAPNINGQPELQETSSIVSIINKRVFAILSAAAWHHKRNIVLGAWGAGVFGNSPKVVAEAFKFWLDQEPFKSAFENVVFAVLDNSTDQTNFNTFNNLFK